ncbi:MAG: FeoA family protein [Anaeromyxobacteraceae bacterium]
MMPLGLLGVGESGEIVGDVAAQRAEDLGLRAGRRVQMLANVGGPVLVKVDGSRIAVDRGVAMRIQVRI